MVKALTLALGLLLASTAIATPPPSASVTEIDRDLTSILQRQREIADRMHFASDALSARQKQVIHREQRRIFSILQGRSSLDELAPSRRIELWNALQSVNAAIDGSASAEERKLVCTHQNRTGSRVSRVRCMRADELAPAKEEMVREVRAF
ncbi:MAG: hypothetical protein KF800_10520 [Lysobacter sp.]|nr:hypothetical protein [Lysobacter sp.]